MPLLVPIVSPFNSPYTSLQRPNGSWKINNRLLQFNQVITLIRVTLPHVEVVFVGKK